MELRSSSTSSAKHDGKDRGTKAMAQSGSDSGTSSAVRSRGSRSASSTSPGRRTSPDKRQMTSKSSCANNEHCSKNDKPVSQRDVSASHDSTNGQVMGHPGNSSASSVQNRQRDALLYVFSSWGCALMKNFS